MKGLMGAVKCWLVSYNACLCSPPPCGHLPPPSPGPPPTPLPRRLGHWVAEVRSLCEGQIINPTK